MGGYGYTYQSCSAYTSGGSRTDEAFGPFIRSSLFPNSYGSSEGYVPKKTVVPVATRPYGHGSATKAYPATDDSDDEWHPQTSPVHGRPHKADDLRAKRTRVPVATRPYDDEFEYQHNSPTARGDDKWPRQTNPVDGRPPKADEFLTKKTRVPVASRPYGEEAYSARDRDDDKWRRQNSPVYDRPHKADDFLAKKTGVPGATTPYGVENKQSSPTARDDDTRCRHTSSPARFSPVISTNWRRSPQSTGADGNYSHTQNDNYDRYQPNRSGPVISPGWTSLLTNGTQLSKPTDDIDKVTELMKEVARLTSGGHSEGGYGGESNGNKRGHKATGNMGVMDRPTPSVWDEPPPSNGGQHSKAVDKRDGTKQYGYLNMASTIDSREAEKKYNGKRV